MSRGLKGELKLPGDKSVSHRALILGAMAEGFTYIQGLSDGEDVRSTWLCLQALSARITSEKDTVTVKGLGWRGLRTPKRDLDAGNSGTTMRLMAGILAAHPFTTTMTGDESLSRRPMRRVIEPLSQMGCRIDATDGRPPLTIHGTTLHAITFRAATPSAQVKSSVLLAGLHTEGTTTVVEPAQTHKALRRQLLHAFGWLLLRPPKVVLHLHPEP